MSITTTAANVSDPGSDGTGPLDRAGRPGRRVPATRGLTAVLSVVGAVTTWVGLLSWEGFTREDREFLLPLALLAAVIVAVGIAARALRTPGALVVLAQIVVSGLVACALVSHRVLPLGAGRTRLVDAVSDALDSASRYASPVPAGVPGIHPLLIAGGLGCLLAVDIVVCTLRRAPLAGLPLLVVYTIPVTMVGTAMHWWIFAITSLGFLVLLFGHEREQVGRWGRQLAGPPGMTGRAARRSPAPASAIVIGVGATAIALAVPVSLPTLNLDLVAFGAGGSGSHQIKVVNPTVDLQRDLRRADDIPLLTVHTSDPDPTYLRIAALTRFDDDEWTSGDRSIPTGNRADGRLPPLQGVSASIRRRSYTYRIDVTNDFSSTWLPTMSPVSSVTAAGDWRFDANTMDFIAAGQGLDTAGESYTQTGVKLDLTAARLDRSRTGGLDQVSSAYLALPADLPGYVRQLATQVAGGQPTLLGQALALQNFFRTRFTYDLSTDLGDGTDDLVSFLRPQGRRGYCQQFAASMAVMARALGIPARVAVGFLAPTEVGPDTFVYSAHDMHAWPELYFPGDGWVRFEPTPATRAPEPPSYAQGTVRDTTPETTPPPVTPHPGTKQPVGSGKVPPDLKPRVTPPPESSRAVAAPAGFPWWRTGGGLLLAVLLLAALAPGVVRRRRRVRRLAGDPEDLWAELRDTVRDLGRAWPASRSPRETRDALVPMLGPHPQPGQEPQPALDRLVGTVERSRYAARAAAAASPSRLDPGLRLDLEVVLASLHAAAPARTRRLARWLPRSVFARPGRRTPRRTPPLTAAGVVDRVG